MTAHERRCAEFASSSAALQVLVERMLQVRPGDTMEALSRSPKRSRVEESGAADTIDAAALSKACEENSQLRAQLAAARSTLEIREMAIVGARSACKDAQRAAQHDSRAAMVGLSRISKLLE